VRSDPAEVAATVDAIESMNRMLIVRANAEPGMPRQTAILAWFSGREESPAGDVKSEPRRAVNVPGPLSPLKRRSF
jgi:hypothetical protein